MSSDRPIGVNVGLLVAICLAVILLGMLTGYAPSWLARDRDEAKAPPPLPVPADDAFEPIDVQLPTVEPISTRVPATIGPANDLAQVRAMQQTGDVAGLAALIRRPIPKEGEREQTQRALRLRVTAVHAIARVGGEPASAVLRAAIEDHTLDLVLRMAAVSALARTGVEADQAYLEARLATEPSRPIREKIRQSLGV